MLTVHFDFEAWKQDKNTNIQKQKCAGTYFLVFQRCNHLESP